MGNVALALKPALWKYVPPTTTIPASFVAVPCTSGRTMGTFPIVCLFAPVPKITCGREKLAPPFVEREKYAGR